MLDIKQLRQNPEWFKSELEKKGYCLDVEKFHSLENKRKALQVETQNLQNIRKVKSKAIGQAKGKGESTEALMQEVQDVTDSLKESYSSIFRFFR